jgi:hypothetical protein
MTFVERLVYWTPAFLFSTTLAAAMCVWVRMQFPNMRVMHRRMISTSLFVVVFALFLYGYNMLFSTTEGDTTMGFFGLLALIFGISSVVVGAVILLDEEQSRSETKSKPSPSPRLLERLPHLKECDVSRLTVDDHYVQVVFSDGRREKLLMRFADAIGEMDQTPGLVTHRSHWVADAYVAGLIKDGAREYVEMRCGARVPVSRRYRPNLVAAGVKSLEFQ